MAAIGTGSGIFIRMRIGILDVGSQGAHLDVLSLRTGRPVRVLVVVKQSNRLAAALGVDGTIAPDGVERLVGSIRGVLRAGRRAGMRDVLAFGTSSIRDAPNREEVTARIAASCGIRLGFLAGKLDARLTYRGAREWAGPRARNLFVADIGGGTLELAAGDARDPRWAVSLPLGAGLLTRTLLPGDPPEPEHVERLRARLARELAAVRAARSGPVPGDALMLATSKTLAQLAVLTGGRDARGRPAVTRHALRGHIPRLAGMRAVERARLDGISTGRAPQILAGALLAEAVMDVFGLEALTVCPWALREGIALTYRLPFDAAHGDRAARVALEQKPVAHLLDALGALRAPLGRTG
jgi:exopolyphosphatase / guanosine-5'-triphosphate,3'-diphosphate pyrophosphatase